MLTLSAVGMDLGPVIGLIAVGGGILIALISIVTSAMNTRTKTREFEQSRREIAAYVAEGSISPDDAAKMLSAGRKPGKEG